MHRDHVAASGEAAFYIQWFPTFRKALFIFCEHHIGKLLRPAKDSHGALAGNGRTHILLSEAHGATDTGAGWMMRIGPQTSITGIHTNLLADRPIQNDGHIHRASSGLHHVM